MLKKKKYAKNVADDGGPDWGDLKHIEKPEGEPEEPPKEVKILTNFMSNISNLSNFSLWYLLT